MMIGVRNHGVKGELFVGELIRFGDSFTATIGIAVATIKNAIDKITATGLPSDVTNTVIMFLICRVEFKIISQDLLGEKILSDN
ncbi:hypothetical protein PN471_15670 [Aphanizomenon sp. CS-733/32]|uniref:hypothetical protein n=1 Tax=Aphanizomenon sp. CS-733/32 TaxID=3021715 RepID=UPI002330B203|nr:hypothetical protein [Aphanizomenon sp. CS-733/32]MDB9310045.1 hypothetical protein [Aphanizomenon sp. CS-733/32]